MSNKKGMYFKGKLLIAMPDMSDTRFEKAVIFTCTHDEQGAMGVVINKEALDVAERSLLDQLDIAANIDLDLSILHGGPMEPSRGLVLHSPDYEHASTVSISDGVCITGTMDVLQDAADGKGPQNLVLTLGYAGWGAGQLDFELQQNAWLIADATPELVFNTPANKIWDKAVTSLGIDPALLVLSGGNA